MRAKKIQTTFGRKIFEKGFIPKHGHLNSFWEGSKPMNYPKVPFFESTARYVTKTRCTSVGKQVLLANNGCDFARKAKHPSTITLLFPARGLASNTPPS